MTVYFNPALHLHFSVPDELKTMDMRTRYYARPSQYACCLCAYRHDYITWRTKCYAASPTDFQETALLLETAIHFSPKIALFSLLLHDIAADQIALYISFFLLPCFFHSFTHLFCHSFVFAFVRSFILILFFSSFSCIRSFIRYFLLLFPFHFFLYPGLPSPAFLFFLYHFPITCL
ncbi:hypothetical protein BZA70DRAFT_4478 [Myxozyma melibiosi]|uniref:Uncharacterized protein n=1 Tax=Myxozyma melibiosi TaxID=54550 RepID=A0ABR1FBI0_9ASCO